MHKDMNTVIELVGAELMAKAHPNSKSLLSAITDISHQLLLQQDHCQDKARSLHSAVSETKQEVLNAYDTVAQCHDRLKVAQDALSFHDYSVIPALKRFLRMSDPKREALVAKVAAAQSAKDDTLEAMKPLHQEHSNALKAWKKASSIGAAQEKDIDCARKHLRQAQSLLEQGKHHGDLSIFAAVKSAIASPDPEEKKRNNYTSRHSSSSTRSYGTSSGVNTAIGASIMAAF